MSKLIVALDTPKWETAFMWATQVAQHCDMVKIGLELFVAAGPAGVKAIATVKRNIMLDLKFNDIPNTVAGAVRASLELQPRILTIHANSGEASITAAREEIEKLPRDQRPLLMAVTVLTHLTKEDLRKMYLNGIDVERQVFRYAWRSYNAGAHGVICSAQELVKLRQSIGADLKYITPGIRPINSESNDQSRIATPEHAIQNGADWIVVGRPITQAASVELAAQAINAEADRASQG